MVWTSTRAIASLLTLAIALALPAETPSSSSSIPAGVPDYAIKYAPLMYLHSQDPYLPSDMQAQLDSTIPKVNLDALPTTPSPSPLTLDNLNFLNVYGRGGVDVFLTSKEDVSKIPTYLRGKKPNEAGVIEGAKTGAIIVAEKEAKTTDVFYMYFYAFNDGGKVMDINFGNHVGDWEHVMIRFVDQKPQSVWLSQHGDGQAFTYAALEKDKSGRPITFSANGTHATYAVDGLHDHTVPQMHLPTKGLLTDYTDRGAIFDLTKSAYYYKWTAPTAAQAPAGPATPVPLAQGASVKRDVDPATSATGLFTPYEPSHPSGYLYFRGHWGDQRYPDNDPRQYNFANQFYKYEGGPTGPAFKEISRKDVWAGDKKLPIWPMRVP